MRGARVLHVFVLCKGCPSGPPVCLLLCIALWARVGRYGPLLWSILARWALLNPQRWLFVPELDASLRSCPLDCALLLVPPMCLIGLLPCRCSSLPRRLCPPRARPRAVSWAIIETHHLADVANCSGQSFSLSYAAIGLLKSPSRLLLPFVTCRAGQNF